MLLPLLLAAASALPGPGLWEIQSGLGGLSGKTEQKCLTQAEVERTLTDPSNHHYACEMSTREVGGGRVRLRGVCTNRKHPEQKVGVSVAGEYTLTSFDLKGTGSAKVIGDLELPVSVSASGRRLAETCTAAAPPAPTSAPAVEPVSPG